MAQAAVLQILVDANTAPALQGLQQTQREISALSTVGRQAGAVVGAAANAAAAATATLGTAAIVAGTRYNTLGQRATTAMENLLGSTERARDMMRELMEFASESPFPRQVFIDSAQRMLAFGFAAKSVIPTLDAIQNAVVAAGGTSKDLEDVVYVLNNIQSTGKFTAREFNMLGMRGINAAKVIGQAMGLAEGEVREGLAEGAIDARDALRTLIRGLAKEYKGAAEGLRGTWVGTLDRLQARVRDFGAAFVEPFIGFTGGGALAEGLNRIADSLASMLSTGKDGAIQFAGALEPLNDMAAQMADNVEKVLVRVGEALDNIDIGRIREEFAGLGPAAGAAAGAIGVSFSQAIPVLGGFMGGISPITGAILGLVAASPELRRAFGGALQEIGGLLQALMEAARPLIRVLTQMAGDVATALLPVFSELVRAIQPVVVVLGQSLARVVQALRPAIPPLGEALVALVQASLPLIQALVPIAPALAEILVALTPLIVKAAEFTAVVAEQRPIVYGLVAAFIALKAQSIALSGAVRALYAWEALVGVFGKVRTAITGLAISARGAMLATGVGALVVAAGLIIENWDAVKAALNSTWNWIKGAAADVGRWVADRFGGPVKVLADVVKRAWAIIKGVFRVGFFIVKNLIAIGVNLWLMPWRKLIDLLSGPLRAAWRWIKGAFRDGFNWVKTAISDAADWIGTAWKDVKGFLVGPIRAAWRVIERVFGSIAGWFKRRFERVKGVLETVGGAIAGAAKGAFDGIKGAIIDGLNWVIDKLNWLIDAYNSTAAKLPGVDEIGQIGKIKTPEQEAAERRAAVGAGHAPQASRPGPIGLSGGQRGGFVFPWGIDPRGFLGFQRGGIVPGRGQKPGPRDVVPALLEPGELVVPREVVEKTGANADEAMRLLRGALGPGYDDAEKETKRWAKRHDKLTGDVGKQTEKTMQRMMQNSTRSIDMLARTGTRSMQEAEIKMGGAARGTQRAVSRSFRSAAGAATTAIGNIMRQTRRALVALGAPGSFGTQRGGNKVERFQTGGYLVSGSGYGDRVPALLEPGEVVWNRRAVRSLFGTPQNADAINKMIPRFQRGGFAELAPGARGLAQRLARMGFTPTSTRRATTTYHGSGQAIDYGDSINDLRRLWAILRPQARRFAELFGPSYLRPGPTLMKFGQGFQDAALQAQHEDHIHVALTSMLGQALGVSLRKQRITGPRGMLRDVAQAAVDRVFRAAQRHVQAAMAATADMDFGAVQGDGSVARQFKRAIMMTGAPRAAQIALFMAGIVESGMRNLPYGDADSTGVLQVRASTARAMGLDPMNPLAVALAFLTRGFWGKGGAIQLARQGLPPGLIAQMVQGSAYPSRYGAVRSQALAWMRRVGLQRGGIVDWAGWFAKGGAFQVNRPTLFGAGERGRENVRITRPGQEALPEVHVHLTLVAEDGFVDTDKLVAAMEGVVVGHAGDARQYGRMRRG